jgi:hypothetical protein
MIKIKKNLKDKNLSYFKLHKITKFYKIFLVRKAKEHEHLENEMRSKLKVA